MATPPPLSNPDYSIGSHDLALAADHSAVRAAVQAYAHAIDSLDYDALAAVFTDDAVARYHNYDEIHGGRAISEFLRERVGATTWHQHFITTTGCRVDGDRAHTTSAFIAHSVNASRPGKIRLTLGSYHDELVRTPAGWRISARTQVTGAREVRDLGDPNG